MLGFQVLLDLLWEWDTWIPKVVALLQISHFAIVDCTSKQIRYSLYISDFLNSFIMMVPVKGLEPPRFPSRFWVARVCHSATPAYKHISWLVIIYHKQWHLSRDFKNFFVFFFQNLTSHLRHLRCHLSQRVRQDIHSTKEGVAFPPQLISCSRRSRVLPLQNMFPTIPFQTKKAQKTYAFLTSPYCAFTGDEKIELK